MRVRCKPSSVVPIRSARDYGSTHAESRTEHDLVPGREYLVFGLSFWSGEVWVEVESEGGLLYSVPLSEFEILSGRPSKYWEIKRQPDGATTLWPRELTVPYFHSDLADGVPTANNAFAKLKLRMLSEE